MRPTAIFICPILALILGGCVAKTVVGAATAPVRAASKVVDWTTTSQDEADRERGREIRRREERLGRLEDDYRELEEDCLDGDDSACREAVHMRNEINHLRPSVPIESDDDD